MRKNFKFILPILLLTAVLTLSFIGCKKEKPKEPYTPPVITTQYTVSYFGEDGTTPIESMPTKVYTHGDRLTYPAVNKTGYYPKWTVYDEEGNETSLDVVTQNLKVVVSFELIDCLVTIHDNLTDSELFNQYYSYGDTFIPELKTEKPGYIFKGYTVDNGATFATEFKLTTSIDIIAYYEPIVYTLNFYYYPASLSPTHNALIASEEVTYGEFVLPAGPALEGYEFDGWYYNDGVNTVKIGDKGAKITVDKNMDLYALYKNKTN